ncbi:MAG: 30S ribosomal protein S17 [Candidatus Parcubacteria bacterium]|nr:30S ribosomal protein S17 [Candidatus Parcubacteria bacterium]
MTTLPIKKIIPKKHRILKGEVVSDKMIRTAVILVTNLKLHPRYHKYYKSTKRFKAENPKNQYHTGDKVLIRAVRPLSKEKKWLIIGLS